MNEVVAWVTIVRVGQIPNQTTGVCVIRNVGCQTQPPVPASSELVDPLPSFFRYFKQFQRSLLLLQTPGPSESVHSLSVTDLQVLRDGRHSQGARHGREGQADGHRCRGQGSNIIFCFNMNCCNENTFAGEVSSSDEVKRFNPTNPRCENCC